MRFAQRTGFRLLSLFTVATTFLTATEASSAALTLDSYLEQVRSQSGAMEAANLRSSGVIHAEAEGDLFFSPKLFSEIRRARDSALPDQPGFRFDRILSDLYTLGISQEFSFGLKADISYEVTRLEFVNANFAGTPVEFKAWDSTPKIQLSLPLWRNSSGAESRTLRDRLIQQTRLERANADLSTSQIINEAEVAYWRLSSTREMVRIQTDAFARAQSLLKFVTDKAKIDLGEHSDVLQTRATLESNRLELQRAQSEERSALLNLNRLQNRDPDAPVDNLEPLNSEVVKKLKLPTERPGERLDVRAASTQLKLAEIEATSAEERNKPDLTAYASYSLNGRSTDPGNSISDPWVANRPTEIYGVRFNMPLDIEAQARARDGARTIKQSVNASLRQKLYEQEVDWKDLRGKFAEAQERAKVSELMTKAQALKLAEEKKRLRNGRASLFNVLLFEQDYLRAEVTRIQSAFDVIQIKLQSSLYQSSPNQSTTSQSITASKESL